MYPRLVHFGNFFLPTYGFLSALGLIVGLLVAAKLAKKSGIDPDHAWNMGVMAILMGIAGSKLLLIVNDWTYLKHPTALLQAGGVFSGGLFLSVVACYIYVVRHGMPVMKTADSFAPGIAIGHAFGRLGCFAAGCCYGKPTDKPWGVVFTDPLANKITGTPLGIHIHPTQLYESFGLLAIFAICMWLWPRRSFFGQVAASYLFLYGLLRYFTEFVRDDPERGSMFGGLMTVTQFLAILMVVVAGLLWAFCPRRTRIAPALAATA